MVRFSTFNFSRKVVSHRTITDMNYAINQSVLTKGFWEAHRYRVLMNFRDNPTMWMLIYGIPFLFFPHSFDYIYRYYYEDRPAYRTENRMPGMPSHTKWAKDSVENFENADMSFSNVYMCLKSNPKCGNDWPLPKDLA